MSQLTLWDYMKTFSRAFIEENADTVGLTEHPYDGHLYASQQVSHAHAEPEGHEGYIKKGVSSAAAIATAPTPTGLGVPMTSHDPNQFGVTTLTPIEPPPSMTSGEVVV